jgi:hypothetical protein
VSVTIEQRLQCLELALRSTGGNKDRAMVVADEFVAFIGKLADTDTEQADKPVLRGRRPRKTAGETADAEASEAFRTGPQGQPERPAKQ